MNTETQSPYPIGSRVWSAAALGTFGKAAEQSVQVVANPQHTRNLFGPVSEIAGKRLKLLERNREGDCLCIFEGGKGTNIVDVDRRDIQTANVRLTDRRDNP